MINQTQIPSARVPLTEGENNLISREWFRYFNNINTLAGGGAGLIPVSSGGTGLSTTPSNGQLLIGNGTGYTLNTLSAGTNIAIANGVGNISVSFSGILSPSQGGTGISTIPPIGAILFGDGTNYTTNANFNYASGTNTISFGNITGSALSMTIQTRAPTSLETPGTLLLLGRDAIKANTDGGSVRLKGGAKTGFGQPGKAELESQDGEYVVRASNAGVDIFGEYSSSFSFAQGVFNAVGAQTAPLVDSPNVFVAGLNSTSTGNASFQFLTDSQVVFEFGEPIFGSQELAFFGVVPVTQPTTATASATRAAVSGTVANVGDTYDGYTLAQVVKALRNLGILA